MNALVPFDIFCDNLKIKLLFFWIHYQEKHLNCVILSITLNNVFASTRKGNFFLYVFKTRNWSNPMIIINHRRDTYYFFIASETLMLLILHVIKIYNLMCISLDNIKYEDRVNPSVLNILPVIDLIFELLRHFKKKWILHVAVEYFCLNIRKPFYDFFSLKSWLNSWLNNDEDWLNNDDWYDYNDEID